MPVHHNCLALAIALSAVLTTCSDGGPARTPEPTIALTRSGACGDAYFWAATESGDIAVTVTVDARERSARAPTVIPFERPDDGLTIEVLRGSSLHRNLCNDAIDPDAEPTSTMPATAGRGEITLDPAADPPDGCGTTTGTLRADGLTASDGTTFEPIAITSHSIGCYSG
jgi:hypothetical protein